MASQGAPTIATWASKRPFPGCAGRSIKPVNVEPMKIAPTRPGPNAFTLLELLVVIAIIVLLAAMIVPVIDRRPCGSPKATRCLNNLKQLSLAWILYADEYDGQLVSNQPLTAAAAESTNNWAGGILDWSANPANTNLDLIRHAKLYTYARSDALFRCPADVSESIAGRRTRSYSVNAFVGDGGNAPTAVGW